MFKKKEENIYINDTPDRLYVLIYVYIILIDTFENSWDAQNMLTNRALTVVKV